METKHLMVTECGSALLYVESCIKGELKLTTEIKKAWAFDCPRTCLYSSKEINQLLKTALVCITVEIDYSK